MVKEKRKRELFANFYYIPFLVENCDYISVIDVIITIIILICHLFFIQNGVTISTI